MSEEEILETDEEDELENLTAAEREAMGIDLDESDEPVSEVSEDEAEITATEEEVESDEESAEEVGEAAEEEAEPEEEPEPQTGPEEERPLPQAAQEVEYVDEYADEKTQLAESLKALKTKYNDGEVDTDEFLEQRDALKERQEEIRWQEKEAEFLYKAEANAAARADERNLQQSISDFYASNPDYAKSEGLQGALDAHWKKVWADPAWQNKSYSARMEEAKARTDKDLGRTAAPAAPTKAEPTQQGKREALKGRGKQPTSLTLADLPNADESTAESEGKYADLDKLDGMALESAIAKKIEQYGESYLDEWLSGTAH